MLTSKSEQVDLLHCPKCNGEFPSQGRERYVTIIETIRANQHEVCAILLHLSDNPDMMRQAKKILADMHVTDRDAILQENGILTSEQIELLK